MDPNAGPRPRLIDQLAARRGMYRRSQTVSSLPIFPENDLSGRQLKTSYQQRAKAAGDVDLRAVGELSPKGKRSAEVFDGFKKTWSFRSTSPRQRGVLSSGCHALLQHVGEKTRQKLPLCRTPSSPSILLSKVRERIKEKVIETSVEWPSMAVIVQEKRQKAVTAFEAQLSLAHGVLLVDHEDPNWKQTSATKLIVKKVLTQSRSTSGEITSVRERSRLELRRRSISMDAFDRMSRSTPEDKCSPSSRTELRGGVICTTDDLKSIMNSFRKDRPDSAPLSDRFEHVPRKSLSPREDNDEADDVTFSGLNLDNHVCSETDENLDPTPSNDSSVRLSCASLSESTSDGFSSNSDWKLEVSLPHATLFRSSSSSTSGVKAKSLASSNRKCFSNRRSASVCSTPCLEKASPIQPFHYLEKTPVAHLKTNFTIKDHATLCLITGRTRIPSSCTSSPRRGNAAVGPAESGLVYWSNDFDPEIFGQAIQVHLEAIMKSRTASDELGETRK